MRDEPDSLLTLVSLLSRPEDKRGTMSEARHDSTSSLQRKKPPWLKLDIPVPVPMAVPEEPPQPVQVQGTGFVELGRDVLGASLCLGSPSGKGSV